MIKINKFHKSVAVLCAVTLLLSIIGTNIFTFADAGASYKHIDKESDITVEGENLLENNLECKKRFMSRSSSTGKLENIWETAEPTTIHDSLSAWHGSESDCKTAGLDNSTTQKDNCWQIHVKLNKTVNNPKTFLFWAHKSEKDKISKHYALFMASSEDELFNEENKVIEISDNTERLGDQIDLTKTGKELTDITYVGLRFYHRGFLNGGFCSTQLINLLGLYGNDEPAASTAHKTYTDKSKINTSEKNNFEGSTGSTAFIANGSNTYEYSNSSNYHDNTIGSWHKKNQADCKSKGYSNSITQKNYFWQLTLALKETINDPKTFLFWAHEAETDKISQHYAVFMADNAASLYDESNKVIEITDTSKRLADEVDLTSLGKSLKNICYVGVRFYHRGYLSGGTCSMQHIKMLGLYGGTKASSSGITAIQNISELKVSGTNYLSDCSYGGGFYGDGQLTSEYSAFGPDQNGNWRTLGAWHYSGTCFNKSFSNDTTQKSSYWQLEIDMPGKLSDPEKFVFLSHDKENTHMSGHYAVFASDSKVKLFDEENKVIEVNDSKARLGDEIDLKELKKDLKNISFVGIRFYHRGYTTSLGCTMQHIKTIGLYGGTFKESTVDVKTYNSTWDYGAKQLAEDAKTYGSDLIAAKTPYAFRVNGTTPSKWVSLAKVTDMKFDEHVDYSPYSGQQDGTCDFIYKLNDDPDVINKIKKFVLRGHAVDAAWADQYITGKYEVYAAVNYTELFNAENMIYSYDYEKDGISRIQTAMFKKDDIYARFVAVRIINPVTTCTNVSYYHPRISEIAFLGSQVDIPPQEKQLNSNMPLSIYVSDDKGNKEDISKNLSLEEYDALMDSDEKTVVNFETAGNQMDFVVNLLKDYKITKAFANTASKMGYSVYISQKFADVWSSDSKVSSKAYEDSSASKTGRYIRFSFDTSDKKKFTATGLLVEGLTNPLIKPYEHLGLSVDSSTVSSFEKPVNSTSIEDINQLSNNFGLTFDGDFSKENNTLLTGGEVGKSTLNVLVKLSGLQNVSEFTIGFPPHLKRYQPTKVNVYFGETYEEAMDLTKAPLKTFEGLPELGKYYSRVKPQLVRYIRIEFVENNYNKGIKNAFGEPDEDSFNKTNMAFALSEIDIVGTSVSGMADENGVLLSFEQSGIKWNVMSLDSNDVPSDIYSAKLIPVETTSAQKKSLFKAPYYKIVDNKAYKIEFYDIFGNVVNNLGGREVEISFPVQQTGEYIIGNTQDASTVKFYDVTSDGSTIVVKDKYKSGMQVALLMLTDASDSYWNGIELNNDTPAPTPSVKPADTDTKKPNANTNMPKTDIESEDEDKEPETISVLTGTETKHSVSYPGIPTYLIVLICIEGVLFLAAVGGIVFFGLRKKGIPISINLPKIKLFKGKK